jgi:hypothetical protein
VDLVHRDIVKEVDLFKVEHSRLWKSHNQEDCIVDSIARPSGLSSPERQINVYFRNKFKRIWRFQTGR